MRKLCLLVLLLSNLNTWAQTKFEKGYFIDDTGVKTEALIKNLDWYKNPSEIQFKMTETDVIQTRSIEDIQEFAVNTYIFQKHTVDLDRAGNNTSNMDRFPEPTFNSETLFLQLIVDGKAQLFRYRATNLVRFFLKTEESPLQQLVYKRYIRTQTTDDNTAKNTVAVNNTYKNQMQTALNCETVNIIDIQNLQYTERPITDLVVKYNQCVDPNYSHELNTRKKGHINVYLRPGVNFINLEVTNGINPNLNRQFESGNAFRIGVEIEGVLPSNNNKWAFVVEPTYQSITLDQSNDNTVRVMTFDYSAILLPMGVRYRMYLNETSIVYVNALFIMDFPISDSVIDFDIGPDLELFSSSGLQLGAGYNFKSRYSLEVRYSTTRNPLRGFLDYTADFNEWGVYFGYNLLRK